MKRQEARENINRRPLTDFITLQLSRKAGRNMYKCPVCGSGTGQNRTGALQIFPDSNRVICYSNGGEKGKGGECFGEKGQDTLGALRIIWGCTETEAITRAGYTIDKEAPQTGHKENIKHNKNTEHKKSKEYKTKAPADYSLFYRQRHEELKKSPEALEYLHGRGITDDSIDRFNLGYSATWKHSRAGEKVQPSKRIIIPRTKGTYTARNIEKPRNEWEENYTKQVQGRQKDLFNLDALNGAETPIICEGELDAISLYQAGAASVVAIGTITNTGVFLDEAKKHPEAVYILALDNDPDKEDGSNSGKTAQRRLAADMKAAGLAYLNADPAQIYGTAKDANEALIKEPERLKMVISAIQGKALEMKAERDAERAEELRPRTGEGMLEDFLLSVTDREARTYAPIKTGINDLDRALEGGFLRKTLVLLGAPPAMGKTAFSQWVLENIAKNQTNVLYINLEMSREQLLARSLSRYAYIYEGKDFSTLDILRGYDWTEENRRMITRAADRYKKDVAPYFIYNPDGVTNSIDSILKAMEAETARIKAQGMPSPIICIDYLQVIDTGERDAIEGLKNVIFSLKQFAKREETVIFAITANNRASNRTGTVEMESGRDTSALEYNGDVMIGLSYTAIEDRRTYEDENGVKKVYDLETIRRLKREAYENGEAVPSVCNEVSVKIIKNRFSEAERRVKLIFDGKHNIFRQTDSIYTAGNSFPPVNEWTDPLEGLPFDD